MHDARIPLLHCGIVAAHAFTHLHQRVLDLRKKHAGLFTAGEYQPLKATGPAAGHVFAFSRKRNGVTAVVVVSKNLAKLRVIIKILTN